MSSIFSVGSGSGQDFYSMFFNSGSSSSSSKSNAAAGIFAGGSTIIGDMSLIKSGAYKKLLNSYYSATGVTSRSSSSSSKTTSSITASTDSSGNLKTAATDAENLMKNVSALGQKSLYSTKKDENGNTVYDMDAIGKAVKSFVDSYNSYIESTGNLNSTSMLSKALSVVGFTSKNSGLLSEIGITIGSDNKLTIDEEKLKDAKATTINSLFVGSGSYGSYVQSKASESYRTATSAIYTNTNSTSYGYNGSYSLLGISSISSLDSYL